MIAQTDKEVIYTGTLGAVSERLFPLGRFLTVRVVDVFNLLLTGNRISADPAQSVRPPGDL